MDKPAPFDRLQQGHRLCALSDLKNPGSKGFVFESPNGQRQAIFVVRKGDDVFGYVNSCPHMGAPLTALKDLFLASDGQILCDKHGALFEVETGLCTEGPCRHHYLQPVPVTVKDGQVLTA
ncbi:Rieske (2Fe-2S) protein [Gallaecimonas mangrovi]|uniref:Rieske (2Fe-2S) protein n=1 Tax=Gallaecimonas mangrovi TaxID=2291597 RepID=UPI000E1FD778|nr:Rieske (2Fe-2S) protein [Gallaecimonas mangrovi]